jgi:hypothetical protein
MNKNSKLQLKLGITQNLRRDFRSFLRIWHRLVDKDSNKKLKMKDSLSIYTYSNSPNMKYRSLKWETIF